MFNTSRRTPGNSLKHLPKIFQCLASGNFSPRFIRQRGFALFVAIILSAVAATITLALTTLAYKSLLLSSAARESQYAFYAADSALECTLYWDSGQFNSFPYTVAPGSVTMTCAGVSVPLSGTAYDTHTTQYASGWFAVNGGAGCARATVYKTDTSLTPVGSLFADGVNVPCAKVGTDPRAVERGLRAYY